MLSAASLGHYHQVANEARADSVAESSDVDQRTVEPPPREFAYEPAVVSGNEESGKASENIERGQGNQEPWLWFGDGLAQWLMVVLGVAATLLSAYAVVLLKRTLAATADAVRSADDAVEVTRNVGEAQVRAYVAIRSIRVAAASANGDPGIDVHFDLKNNGQTPAMEVRVFLISHSPSDSKSNLCMFHDIASEETAKNLRIKFFPNPNPFTDKSEGAEFRLPNFTLIVAHKIALGNKTVFEAAMFSVENDFSQGAPRFGMMPNMFNAESIEKIARRHYELS